MILIVELHGITQFRTIKIKELVCFLRKVRTFATDICFLLHFYKRQIMGVLYRKSFASPGERSRSWSDDMFGLCCS